MSVHVSSWAWKQKLGDPGLKLVLVKLADNADENGYSFWRQQRLAEECEMSRSTVQRKLKTLSERGIVEVIERANGQGRQVANGYRIIRPPVPQPDAPAVPQHGDAPGASSVRQQEPSEEPPEEHAAAAHARDPLFEPPTEFRPREVDGRPVTAAEASRATQLLATFNRLADTRFKSQEYLRGIILRIRRFPEINDVQHELAMSHVLTLKGREKWWDDPAPNIVYGNDAAFERALHGSRRRANAPPSEFAAYAGGRSAEDVLREQLGEEGFAAWQAEQDAEEAQSIRSRGVPDEVGEFRERIGEERFRVAWGEGD